MAQLSTIKSAISGKDSEGQPAQVVGRMAGFGSIFGIIAAVVGFIAGFPLVPITANQWTVITESPLEWTIAGSSFYPTYVMIFMFLLTAGFLFQGLGSKNLREFLGSSYAHILTIAFLIAGVTGIYAITGYNGVFDDSLIPGYLSTLYLLGAIFTIVWQLSAVIYVDSHKGWIGFLAGILNGLFIPVLALSQVFGVLLVYTAYASLLVGQLLTLLFWWSPMTTIREFARSPEKGKLAFGLTGLLTFIIGSAAVFIGPIGVELGVQVWRPWGVPIPTTTGDPPMEFFTNPALVYGFAAMLLLWIMLAPRLGAKELKAAHVGEDILKGGTKYFAVLLALFGILAAAQAGLYFEGVATWGFLLTVCPCGAMFVVGAAYAAKTDLVSGLPLVVTSVFLMIAPYTLAPFVIFPWIAIIITQALLLVEIKIRGLSGFSQGSLTVLISIGASIVLIGFMLGMFGSGPLALWPTNRWFNITLFASIPPAIQSATIVVLPFLALLVRNVSLSGYAYGRGYTTGGILTGASMMFAIMIPVIAGNDTIGHVANTGAALVLALYSISLVLVMSLNLNLANDVDDKGKEFEGSFIRVGTLAGVVFAAVMVVLVLVFFSGIPGANQIAFVVSMMVTFVVGAEIISIIGWLIAGIRLGMLKEGFKFRRLSQ